MLQGFTAYWIADADQSTVSERSPRLPYLW